MTLAGYLAVLRRRSLVVLVCVIAGLGGALLHVHRTPKLYSATATYFVTPPSDNTGVLQANSVTVAETFLDSFQQLASKRSTADAVATALGIDPGQVAGHLSSSVESGTFYIDVTATDADPNQARVLADAGAQVVTDLIPQIQGDSKNPALAKITDKAELPGTPYQPTPKRTILLGLLLGAVVGLALVALLEALDRRVRSSHQAAHLADAPMLALVPRLKTSGSASVLADNQREPYRALRTSVNFLNPDQPPVTIMITSPMPGDGKTTTAANLATTMAEAGAEVLLIDADLRRSQLTKMYSLRRSPGVTSVVTRTATLADVLLKEGGLFFLPSGPTPPNPSELLGSQSAVDLIAAAKDRFDIVIVDVPPVLAVSDALSLAAHVDAVLMVVRHGSTARPAIAEAVRRLQGVGRPPSGIIYNAVPRSESQDYYGEYAYVE